MPVWRYIRNNFFDKKLYLLVLKLGAQYPPLLLVGT
jgi:hypothetical protein